MTAIDVSSISKTFTKKLTHKVRALNDVSFSVPHGNVFGFIGPNGAGKSTTIKILMGLLRPDAGSTSFYGKNSHLPEARGRVGYLAENPAYYDYLTPRELLEFVARYYKVPGAESAGKVDEVLRLIELTHAADRPIRSLSKGMVQRIGLGQTLVHDPDLYILDEPMSGLDPLGRALVTDIIQQLKARGKTVFFSTHIIHDVERVCDDVALLLGGSLQFCGAVKSVIDGSFNSYEVVIRRSDELSPSLPDGVAATREGDAWRLSIPRDSLNALLSSLSRENELLSVEPERRTLEQIFLDLIKSHRSAQGRE
ncbi:ABC transporter ATP-binding protein [Geomonas sp. Red69]|uniref:ABC transporter ATP-binding protein n=1 Tax=Geomonas diazotrophica TaxID=2843197 RepID=A0ABX8JMR5_9BACT|nr:MULTISPECIES: ABC transporter ATP-binding protein [Geomonas]MBU5636469.1 ABC transporter ATP-binding protein [Geomonas diazotrophica]QWV99028.1 ABC transporter ATP-binding protein [Geomonas nitrogeniifigens]QXE88194.1 ABC transporter ATP-binding protein [Geomonas nitrogeniifigens]